MRFNKLFRYEADCANSIIILDVEGREVAQIYQMEEVELTADDHEAAQLIVNALNEYEPGRSE
ncbi:hypothetical protein LCGC14_2648350 [marine sediment metagenome]|uniref:Uncharacterized protein n=1 Tax=marine sediment metagenome TaxID=412755 RepID=A0A0F9C620_9ZZZZ